MMDRNPHHVSCSITAFISSYVFGYSLLEYSGLCAILGFTIRGHFPTGCSRVSQGTYGQEASIEEMAPLDSAKESLGTQLQSVEERMECESPEPHPLQDNGSFLWFSMMSQSMGDDNLSSLDTNEAEIEPENMREKFFRSLAMLLENKSNNTKIFSKAKYCQLIKEVKEAKAKAKKESVDYRRLARFDVILVQGNEKLIEAMTQNQPYHRSMQQTPCERAFSSEAKLGLSHSQLTEELVASLHTENELDQADKELENTLRAQYEENIETGTDSSDIEENLSVTPKMAEKSPPERRLRFLSCVVCEKECTGVNSCISCDGNIHAICGVPSQHETEGCGRQITCSLCYETSKMKRKRDEIQRSFPVQPSKMLKPSGTTFSPDKVGDWVRLHICHR
ncbi:hypothetical protein H8959_010712 [Pygathrix nigripes]